MSRNYYSKLNLHLTWHTKDSLPLLTDQVEPLAYRYLRQKIINAPGRSSMNLVERKRTCMLS